MKHLLLTTIAAVLLAGCGESQRSTSPPESKPVALVAEAAKPEPPTAKAPDILIHDAAYDGNIEAVKQHLASGADVNVKDKVGWTRLHHAAWQGHKEVIELLIAKGADVNATDRNGKTPLDRADNKETADLLRKHGGKTGVELSIHKAAEEGNIEAVKQHLDAGADVNAKGKYGRTPTHNNRSRAVVETG